MAATTPVPLDYVFASRVQPNTKFGCEIYETAFRIPIERAPLGGPNPPSRPPCFGPWLNPEWVNWIHNHPALYSGPDQQARSDRFELKQRLLREVIWPRFASHIMLRSVVRNLFFSEFDMLGMLNWYRKLFGFPQEDFVEPDSHFSDGIWWFMLADSPWAGHCSFDDVMFSRKMSEPGPDVNASLHGLAYAPEHAVSWRTAFWDTRFPMMPGLESVALSRLCQVMKEDAVERDWEKTSCHWQTPKGQFRWIKYWGPTGYRGSLGDLLSQREQWLKALREAFAMRQT